MPAVCNAIARAAGSRLRPNTNPLAESRDLPLRERRDEADRLDGVLLRPDAARCRQQRYG